MRLKLPVAELCKPIEFCAPVVFRFAPIRAQPTGFLQAMESGKQRAGLDLKGVLGHLGDAAGDPQAVHRFEGQHFKNEHIQRALE